MSFEDGKDQLVLGCRFSIFRDAWDMFILLNVLSTGKVENDGHNYGVGYEDRCMEYGVLPTDTLIIQDRL